MDDRTASLVYKKVPIEGIVWIIDDYLLPNPIIDELEMYHFIVYEDEVKTREMHAELLVKCDCDLPYVYYKQGSKIICDGHG